jgi:hypothetical protein
MDDHKVDDPAQQERLFFTKAEAAAALQVHPSTLRRLVKAGRSQWSRIQEDVGVEPSTGQARTTEC